MNEGEQVLKTRDDKAPVLLSGPGDEAGESPAFGLGPGSKCSWLADKDLVGPDRLRPRIEPWLTALFQSEHLSLLVGSGLPVAVHELATGEPLPGMGKASFAEFNERINSVATESAAAAGRGDGNIEDQIRVANELIRGLQILAPGSPGLEHKLATLSADLERVLGDFAASILAGERGLIVAESEAQQKAFNYLVSFLMSFASRTGTRDRLQVFTTNYDRYLEAGAEVAGIHIVDRFVGSLAPIFRSSRLDIDMHYNPPGMRGEPRYLEGVVRLSKLHGSLDWVDVGADIRRFSLPFGAGSLDLYLADVLGAQTSVSRLMVFPNAAKDRETADYPYADLFRDLASAACRPNSTVVTFGYGFGDEHINRVIADMLTIPSTHLVVMSHGDPLGRIMGFYEDLGRHAQISLLLGNHLGDLKSLVDHYLPKPAIDKTMFRMGDLLRARWNPGKEGASPGEDESGGETEE